jgi:hypothetical protein
MTDVLPPPDTSADPVPLVCGNCAASVAGAYCAACGQPAGRGRLTLRSVATRMVADALDLNRGLFFTFLELWRRPGGVARDYVRGRTVTYANPVKYFLVMGALTTLVYVQTGLAGRIAEQFAAGISAGSTGMIHPRAEAVVEVINSYFTLFLAFTLPSTAAASRLAFRKAGYNYAEHLVFNTYIGAQQCVLIVLALVLSAALGGDPQVVMQWSIPAATALYVWAAVEFVGGARTPAAVRAVVANVLSYVGFMLVSIVVGIVALLALR